MTSECPTCGLNREAAISCMEQGDRTMQYLISGCPDCTAYFQQDTELRREAEASGVLDDYIKIIQLFGDVGGLAMDNAKRRELITILAELARENPLPEVKPGDMRHWR